MSNWEMIDTSMPRNFTMTDSVEVNAGTRCENVDGAPRYRCQWTEFRI